jgi:hypothetical protein
MATPGPAKRDRAASPPHRLPPLPACPPAPRNASFLQLSTSPAAPTVRSARGLVTIPAAAAALAPLWDIPPGANLARLAPLLGVASAVLAPSNSARVKTSTRVLRDLTCFMAWLALPLAALTGDMLIAYAVARCCPPVGTVLPSGWPAQPVLPTTVKTELGALRSAAKVGMVGASLYLEPLCAPRLSAFMKSIGANVSRLKSNKKPMLWSRVLDFITPILVRGRAALLLPALADMALQIDIRDAFAVVIGFCTGSRCRELLDLMGADMQVQTVDARDIIEVTFRQTKTRRTVLGTHDPFVSFVSKPVALELWTLFDKFVGWNDAASVWVSQRGRTSDPLGRGWFAQLVARVDPDCSPHCLRVGLATELWASGCKVEQIMTAGRWTSHAAVLYIIGSVDRALVAADAIGGGGLAYVGESLRQKGFGTGLVPPTPAAVLKWLKLITLRE